MVLLKKEISIIEGPRYMHLFDIYFKQSGSFKAEWESWGGGKENESFICAGKHTQRLEARAMAHVQKDRHKADAVAQR